MGRLPAPLKDKFKQVPNQLPNKLRTNRFEPSDPKTCFSLGQFGYNEKSIVWVNQDNLKSSLERLCEEKVIGIDTESRVARTSLDNSYDVLATIQIATSKEVFVFDAYELKKNTIEIPQIQAFFTNKDVTIVGHTLEADLNGDVTQLLGFKGKV